MIKVVIICHDFPPLKCVAAFRPQYWMQNLHQYGIYPVVFTRNWPENIGNHRDKFHKHALPNFHTKESQWELFKISTRYTLRSKLISKYGFEKYSLFRRFLTLIDWFKEHFTMTSDEYAPMFHSIEDYLKINKVDVIIVSGGPFHFYKYGWYFHKKYGIPWLPDYRDEWSNLSKVEINKKNFFQLFEPILEKKWTSNALSFITVSEGLRIGISKDINKEGAVVRNGYNEQIIPEETKSNAEKFIISFAGTIYEAAYLDIFIEGFEQFIDQIQNSSKIKLLFIGIDLSETKGTKRVHQLRNKYPEWIEIVPPMEHKDCLVEMSKSSVLLSLIPGSMTFGFLSTKIYDYIVLKKPIINIESVEKSAEHELSKFLIKCENSKDFSTRLLELYSKWQNDKDLGIAIDNDDIFKYSRAYQTKILAELLIKVTSNNENH